MRHLKFKRIWLGLGALMLALVFSLSVNTIPAVFELFMVQDKVAHAVAYAALMAWFSQIFRHDLTRLVLVVCLALFGLGIEFVQGMVPARHFDYNDMLANTAGIICAWALAYTWVGNMFVKAEQAYCRLRLVGPVRI